MSSPVARALLLAAFLLLPASAALAQDGEPPLTAEWAKSQLTEYMQAQGVAEPEADLVLGLLDDHLKAGHTPANALSLVVERHDALKADKALLAEFAKHVDDEVKKGAKADAVDAAWEEKFRARAEAARRSAETEQVKAAFEEAIQSESIPKEEADLLRALLDNHLKAGYEPYTALSLIFQVRETSKADKALLADFARFMDEEVKKGAKAEAIESAAEEKFRARFDAARRAVEYEQAAAALEQAIKDEGVSKEEADNLRALLADLRKAEWESGWAFGALGEAYAVTKKDKTYLADLAKLVAEEVQKGVKGEALGETIQAKLGARADAVRREVEDEQVKEAIEEAIQEHGVSKEDADLVRALVSDFRKAEWDANVVVTVARETLEVNKKDKTYLADLAKLVAEELKKGTKGEPLGELVRSKLGARRDAALGGDGGSGGGGTPPPSGGSGN